MFLRVSVGPLFTKLLDRDAYLPFFPGTLFWVSPFFRLKKLGLNVGEIGVNEVRNTFRGRPYLHQLVAFVSQPQQQPQQQPPWKRSRVTNAVDRVSTFHLLQNRILTSVIGHYQFSKLDQCSGYLRKGTAVVSIVLPFAYHGLAHYAVFLKDLHCIIKNLHWNKGRNP